MAGPFPLSIPFTPNMRLMFAQVKMNDTIEAQAAAAVLRLQMRFDVWQQQDMLHTANLRRGITYALPGAAPDKANTLLPVFLRGRVVGHLHCIAAGGGVLKWYGGSAVCAATGDAKTRGEAAADVATWAEGGSPAYVQHAVVPTKKRSFVCISPPAAPGGPAVLREDGVRQVWVEVLLPEAKRDHHTGERLVAGSQCYGHTGRFISRHTLKHLITGKPTGNYNTWGGPTA